MTYLKYKAYLGTIEPDIEAGNLFGKLAFIKDLVTYEANTIKQLEDEFKVSVDLYLKSCESLDKAPDTPCKGTFNIRISPELHQKAVIASGEDSLNVFVGKAIAEKIEHLRL